MGGGVKGVGEGGSEAVASGQEFADGTHAYTHTHVQTAE